MEIMDSLLFRLLACLGTFLAVWLAIGQRQVSEFSPLDFIISISAGTIAGAAIVDNSIELANAIAALILLGAVQILMDVLSIKSRYFYHKVNYSPILVMENGKMLKKNMSRARISVETLLQLLREKEIFDITEIEAAILEPHGKLSVLRKAEYLPVTPDKLNLPVKSNNILVPVALGELREGKLKELGFSQLQIKSFADEYKALIDNSFVVFMNQNKELYTVENGVGVNEIKYY